MKRSALVAVAAAAGIALVAAAGLARRPATCPAEMVKVPGMAACIDRFEASLEGKRLSARAVSRRGIAPAVLIEHGEASAACARSGKRLCSKEEWSAACRGDGGKRKYAYGDHYEPKRCHDRALSDARHTTAPLPSGALDTCVTPEGVYDLSGNVWEWLAGTSSDGKVASYLGGGFFNDDDEDTQSCQPEDPSGQPPASRLPAVGFRCCRALAK